MLFDLSNELHAASFKARCEILCQKKSIVEIKERKHQRTRSQNSYLHAALGYFGAQTGYTLEEVKAWYFKELCNPSLFVTSKVDRYTGEIRKVLRSSAELNTEEMTEAIERFRNWAAQEAGVYIPSPEEHRLIAQMEVEAERCRNFI